MKKSLIALAFGTLALGMSEFVMMGILPDIARSLGVSIPEAGHLISAYALGAYCGGLPIDHGLGYRYTALAGMGFVLLGLLTVVIYIRKYPRHEMR